MDAESRRSPIDRTVAPWPFDQVTDSDIVLASSDNVVFYFHKLLLSLVSPVFKTMFTLPLDQSQDIYDERPYVPLTEDSKSLSLLLSWCDPRCTSRSKELADLERALELADKYGMESVIKHVENFMLNTKDIRSNNPVEVFAICVRFRFEDLARTAAKETLESPFEDLIPMARVPATRHISGYCLQNLLQYHIDCTIKARDATRYFNWLYEYLNWDEVRPFTRFACRNDKCPITLVYDDVNYCAWLNWWLEYMDLAGEALSKQPTVSSITSAAFLDKIHAKISAISCDDCRQIMQDSFFPFNNFLAKEVGRRIEKEKIVLEFGPS